MITLIKRTISHYFKSSKEYIFLFIFPIIFITAEYMMMENIMNKGMTNPIDNISINYEIEDGSLFNEEDLKRAISSIGIDVVNGKSEKEDDIEIVVKKDKLVVITSNETTGNQIVESINNFLRSESASAGRNTFNDVKLERNIIKEEGKISSKDYYGVTMLSMFFISIGMMSSGLTTKDKIGGIKERFITIGISNKAYYSSSLLGYLIIGVLGLLPGYIYSYFVLKTNWGGNVIIPYLSMIPYMVLFISLVTLLSTILKNGEKVVGILGGIAFPILGGLGGAFFPIESYIPKWLNTISYISPLKWFNDGIMNMVYKDSMYTLIVGALVALFIGVGILSITIYCCNKEEVSK